MAIVHAVRHGQVDNPARVLYERLPGYHLSATGRAMAELTAAYLATYPASALWCSPLERAQESMAPIAARFPELAVVTDVRLIEAGNVFAGQIMGSTAEAAKSPKQWPHLRNPFRPSWGEPYTTIAARMIAAITDLATELGPDGQGVAVSHQLPIWVARRWVEGRHLWHDPRRRQCTLSSVTSFTVTNGVITDIEYAEPAASLLGTTPHFGF